MKKLLLILIISIIPLIVVLSQTKVSEIGLSYSGYDLFGIRYRIGNENSQFRFTLLNIGGLNGTQKGENSETKTINQGLAFNFGLQKLKSLSDDLKFYYGADLLSSLDNQTFKNITSNYKSTDKTITAGLGCVLGVAFYFTSNVNLSAEVLPSIWYSSTKSTNSSGGTEFSARTTRIGYGFNKNANSYANLTLSFRINPRPN